MNILINKIPLRQPDNSFVGVDAEFFNQEKHLLHRPHGTFACLQICVVDDPDNVYVITDDKLIDLAMGRIDNCHLVGHNLSYDITQLRQFTPLPPQNIWDLMIIERILWAGVYNRFSLKDIVRRYCDIIVNKEARDDFSKAKELTPELIEYAARDAWVTVKAFIEQQKVVKQNRWAYKSWKEIDRPALWAYQDFMGFRVDVDAWQELYEYNLKESERLYAEFPFNPNSTQQVKKFLQETGFKGLQSTGAKVLPKWIDRHPNTVAAEIGEKVLHYRKVAKRASTYGMNFIEPYLEEVDGVQVIFPDYNISHAVTGREGSRMHNIPIREAPEFRKCFIPRPGNKLVVADWSAQEARGHAFYTKDKNLLEIFASGKDVYAGTVNLMYGTDIDKSDPRRNEIGKPAFLGACYGQSPKGLSEVEDIPLKKAEEIQERFWKAFPDSAKWCEQQKKKTDYVETACGRRHYLNPFTKSDSERNSLNSPHQGLGADMKKKTLAAFHQNWDFDYPFAIVHENHDEFIADVPEEMAPDVGKFMEYWMVKIGEDMCPGIPFVAKAKIVDNWLEGK